jgi:hypothetical protein
VFLTKYTDILLNGQDGCRWWILWPLHRDVRIKVDYLDFVAVIYRYKNNIEIVEAATD